MKRSASALVLVASLAFACSPASPDSTLSTSPSVGPGAEPGPGGGPSPGGPDPGGIIDDGDDPSMQGPGIIPDEVPAGCGDMVLAETEACDDGNNVGGDGCAGDCSTTEPGFSCAQPGQACLPIAVCGDGVKAGSEQCDDGNLVDLDGCSARCRVEIGSKCDGSPSVCTPTTCGDGLKEGAESCDDGNTQPFDGCSEKCIAEPACTPGAGCTSGCGDGLVIGEQCDDGNSIDGDGCSSLCTTENGFMCEQLAPPCEMVGGQCVLRVPAIFRDHSGTHPDFGPRTGAECTRSVPETGEIVPANALTTGLVLAQVDAEGRPQLAQAQGTQLCEAGANVPSYVGITQFNDWFRDGPHVTTVLGDIVLFDNGAGAFVNRFGANGEQFQGYATETGDGNGAFVCSWCLNGSCQDRCNGAEVLFDGSPLFFPVDSVTGATSDPGQAKVPAEYGYTAWPWESDVPALAGSATTHNFYFTSEVQTWLQYTAATNATLAFTGDDDVWVFVNGILAVDLGGIHVPEDGEVAINATSASRFGMVEGGVYDITVFQAERRMEGSSFRLTLSGFENTPSECRAFCGDGIVAFGEECDEGAAGNDGGYGECDAVCRLGEYCGDGVVNGPEQCDSGPISKDGCAGCRVIAGAR